MLDSVRLRGARRTKRLRLKVSYRCIAVGEDLVRHDTPILVGHGDEGQEGPFRAGLKRNETLPKLYQAVKASPFAYDRADP